MLLVILCSCTFYCWMLLLHISSEAHKPDVCCAGRFLYRHLLMFYSQTASLTAKSVFQRNSDGTLLSLKSGISLHLYVNQLPKGTAQIPFKLSRSWHTGRKFTRPITCIYFSKKSFWSQWDSTYRQRMLVCVSAKQRLIFFCPRVKFCCGEHSTSGQSKWCLVVDELTWKRLCSSLPPPTALQIVWQTFWSTCRISAGQIWAPGLSCSTEPSSGIILAIQAEYSCLLWTKNHTSHQWLWLVFHF